MREITNRVKDENPKLTSRARDLTPPAMFSTLPRQPAPSRAQEKASAAAELKAKDGSPLSIMPAMSLGWRATLPLPPAGDGDGIDSSRRAPSGGRRGARGTASRLQQNYARNHASTAPISQRRRFAPSADPSPTRLRPATEPGRIERPTPDQAARVYRAGYGCDFQRGVSALRPIERDGSGSECGSGCGHNGRRRGLGWRDGAAVAAILKTSGSGTKADLDRSHVPGGNVGSDSRRPR